MATHWVCRGIEWPLPTKWSGNGFWASPSARSLLEGFKEEAKAAGYDFFQVIVDPKTKVHRTLYECEKEHMLMTQALDQAYRWLFEWYEAQMDGSVSR
jgi:hypothetical protein